jgi:cytoskeleton protein RodZ
MNNVSQINSQDERKEKRRLHLREIAQEMESVGTVESSDTSDNEAATATPAVRETVGSLLRAARVERGEEAAQVAAVLKMRRDQLQAIEDNDFDRLPGRTYTVGFVRAYASYLGLDAEEFVQQFKDENAAEPFAKPVEHVFPEAAGEQKLVPNGSILIWALLIAMLIYAISYLTLPARKSPTGTAARADESGVVVEQPQALQAPAATVVTAPATVAETSASETAANGEAEVGFVGGDKMLPDDSDPSDQSPILRDTPPQVAPFKVAEVIAVAANAAPTKSEPARIVFKALQPTYIQIKDPNQSGAILISRVLEPGETYLPPTRVGLVMQTGNAGGLQVEVDGRVIGVMGKNGEVIARMPLDASYFLERLATQQ